MSKVWHVVVTREDGSWVAHVPAKADGVRVDASTWARNLPALDRYVREVIVLGADLPDEAMAGLDIAYEYRTGDPALDAAAADLRARRTDLAEATAALTQDTAGMPAPWSRPAGPCATSPPCLASPHSGSPRSPPSQLARAGLRAPPPPTPRCRREPVVGGPRPRVRLLHPGTPPTYRLR